jgi:hypothetical protein
MPGWTSARPRSATSWPTWRRPACWSHRTPPPGASPPRRATGCSSTLLQVKPLGDGELQRLRSELPAGGGTQALLGNTSELLSAMTHFAGVVSVPKREQFAFRQIEFVPLDPQRVLAILVFADGEVQNRVVQVRRAFDPAELEQTANYLNAHFAGQPLAQIRAALLRDLRQARSEMERLLASRSNWPNRPSRRAAPFRRHAGGRADPADGPAGPVRPGSPARPVRGLRPQARDPAIAGTHRQAPGRAHLHRRGNRAGPAGGGVAGDRALRRGGRCWACWA